MLGGCGFLEMGKKIRSRLLIREQLRDMLLPLE